jgi:hypothetical protein
MHAVPTRFGLSVCLLAAALTSFVPGSSARERSSTVQNSCASHGAPSLFPYGTGDPVHFSTNFNGTSAPPGWWVPPSYTFNQYTVHSPVDVAFTGAYMELTNGPDKNGTQQDMGIAGESPTFSTWGETSDGGYGDSMLMAWCARVTNSQYVDTDFELGQADSRPWPPEIDLAEGAGNGLNVIIHWTCDASIPGCPHADGYFNGTVAAKGSYAPWPPPGVLVGDHYFCNVITNGAGQQVYNDPSDGHYDYDCRAQIALPLPNGGNVANWNQYGAEFNPGDNRFSVWVDGQPPVIVTDLACGSHLLFDDNGFLSRGQIENGGASEPCLQASGNWQWDIQQTEWMGRKTVAGLTSGESDTADVAWFGDYLYNARPSGVPRGPLRPIV